MLHLSSCMHGGCVGQRFRLKIADEVKLYTLQRCLRRYSILSVFKITTPIMANHHACTVRRKRYGITCCPAQTVYGSLCFTPFNPPLLHPPRVLAGGISGIVLTLPPHRLLKQK